MQKRTIGARAISGPPRLGHGAVPSVQRILDLVDTTDPAWPEIAAILREFAEASVELDEPVTLAAVKLGKYRWASGGSGAEASVQGTLASTEAIVYYVRRADLIKIGTTINPVSRFGDLMPDEILAFEPGWRPEEALRHRQFRKLRVTGEYFRDAPELREHISQIRAAYGDPDPAWPTMKRRSVAGWRPAAATSTDMMAAWQAEAELGIKYCTLRGWVNRGRLNPAGRDGRWILYYRQHLIELRDTPRKRMITRL